MAVQKVDRSKYIADLVALKIFASTMSFMFGSELQYVLPSNDYDLRWYLEKHLMNKPNLRKDYAELEEKSNSLHTQKKSIASTVAKVNELEKRTQYATEIRRQKADAVSNRC